MGAAAGRNLHTVKQETGRRAVSRGFNENRGGARWGNPKKGCPRPEQEWGDSGDNPQKGFLGILSRD